jgi:hypothetical protein
MEEFCRENDMGYLNLDSDCLGENGLVHPDFLHPNPLNHHYHKGRYVRLLCKRLGAWFAAGNAHQRTGDSSNSK